MFAVAFPLTLLLLLAALATLALRGSSAARRHAIWRAALAAALLLPLVPAAFTLPWPAWTAPAPASASGEVLRTVVNVTATLTPAFWDARWLWYAWLAGALMLAGRYTRAYIRAEQLARQARWLDADAFTHPQARVPFVCGLFAPRIILPEECETWERPQREAVLAHERMHLRRGDLWSQLLGHAACCLYWPHPLVWMAAGGMRKECERACDDGVLAGGAAASGYAAHLIAVGRAALPPTPAALAGGISMTNSPSLLTTRVEAILDPQTNRAAAGGRFLAATALAAGLAMAAATAVPVPAWAQAAGKTLTGRVKDPSGAVIDRARLDLRCGEDIYEVLFTNAQGEFDAAGLPDRVCDITVHKDGFAKMTQTGVSLGRLQERPFDVVLQVAAMRTIPDGPKAPGLGRPPAVTGQVGAARMISDVPQPESAPKRIRVGGNVQSANLEYKAPVLYPAAAKADRVQGTVVLRAVIGREGQVLTLEPMNRLVDARLVESATTAVNQWRYRPTLLNGSPVEVTTMIEINFTLAP